MHFEFDDVRRIHQPYTDAFTRRKKLNTESPNRACVEGPSLQLAHDELEERHVRLVDRGLPGKINQAEADSLSP